METSELPSRLYHYTTFEGLKGIFESKSLWASHGRFLNDSSELLLFKDRLETHIQELLHSRNNTSLFVEQCKTLTYLLCNPLENEAYFISFCGNPPNEYTKNNGLLSQWRGYGKDGGCIIVFNTQKIKDLLLKEKSKLDYGALELASVVYSDDKKGWENELASSANVISSFAIELYDHLNNNKPRPDSDKVLPNLLKGITRYKHCSFKEEHEVRIIAIPTVHDDIFMQIAKEENRKFKPEVARKFRVKDGYQIPYIDLFNSDDFLSSIERIIVGPHQDKEKRRDYLKVWLRHKSIDIHASDTPYVG